MIYRRDETSLSHVVLFIAPPQAVSVIRTILAQLPREFPAAVLFLLHSGTGQEKSIAQNLNVNSGLLVMPGRDGAQLRNDHGYVILPTQNLAIGSDGCLTSAFDADTLDDDLVMHNNRISPNTAVVESEALLESMANRYRSGAIAVALTALEPREVEGFQRVREASGHTLDLDAADRHWEDSSSPKLEPEPTDEVLSAEAIGKRILEIFSSAKVPALP